MAPNEFRWSTKQYSILEEFPEAADSGLLLCIPGAMGSGKSEIAVWAWLDWIAEHCSDIDAALVGRSQVLHEALARKVEAWLKAVGRPGKVAKRNNVILPGVHGENKLHRIIATPGPQALDRHEGPTYHTALLDDVCRMPWEFTKLMMERTRGGGPCVLTYYPRGARHPVKTEVEDNIKSGDIPGTVFRRQYMPDNPSLDPAYIAERKRSLKHSPSEYANKILAEWCSSEGCVFPFIQNHLVQEPPKAAEVEERIVGVDWAMRTVTAAVSAAVCDEQLVFDNEWYHDARASGEISDKVKAQRLADWGKELGTVSAWYIDPVASSMIHEMRRLATRGEIDGEIIPAYNDIEIGVKSVNYYSGSGALKFVEPTLEKTLTDVDAYVWRDSRLEVGVEEPTKTASISHWCDCIRYATVGMLGPVPVE